MFIPELIYSNVSSQIVSIKKERIASYLLEKLQERNPLFPSVEYKKKSQLLKKRINYLKDIERDYSFQLRENPNEILQSRVNHLNGRVNELKKNLDYLHTQETVQRLIKWSTPCNLIFPGSGDTLRYTAYAIKTCSAMSYNFSEVKRVAKEIAFASSISVLSRFVYGKIRSLKKYMTLSSFRSCILSTLKF